MTPHTLTNFERQNYYQNEPKFKSVYAKVVIILNR